MKRITLMSYGIHTPLGYNLIKEKMEEEKPDRKKILFITLEQDHMAQNLVEAGMKLGFRKENITVAEESKIPEIRRKFYDFIYVSEGNTFALLEYIRKYKLVTYIRNVMDCGGKYIGVSAGAHIAGVDVKTALPFDENVVNMKEFEALKLYPGVTIPHYDAGDISRYCTYKNALFFGGYEEVHTVTDEEILELP